MKLYALTIIFNGDEKFKYKFTNVVARSEEEAIEKMKRYVSERGYFEGKKPEDVIQLLSVTEISEIEISKE